MKGAEYCVFWLLDEEYASLTALAQQRRVASRCRVRAQCRLAVATNGIRRLNQQAAPA